MTAIFYILMIGVLIAVHEAGHMLIAKACNIYVQEYAIGFGPKLFSIKGKETTYTIRLIPLGGFTAMVEQESSQDQIIVVDDEQFEQYQKEDPLDDRYVIKKSRTFYAASPIKRMATLLAGPLFNLLTAIVIFVGIFVYNGGMNVIEDCIISEVVTGMAADQAGVLVNDEVTGITFEDGSYVPVESYVDFDVAISLHKGNYTIHILRDGQPLEIPLQPQYNEEQKKMMIGVSLAGHVSWQPLTFFQCISEGTKYTFNSIAITIQSVIQMFSGKVDMNNVTGTIGMYTYTEEALSYGFISYLSLVASISISLAIMNLVPIPVLDGGRMLMTVIEMIIGKRLDKRVENALLIAGSILIFGLFIYITFQDIFKMIG